MNQDYVCLEASLAESICTYFYRKHGYMVQPFGIETIVGNAFYFLDVKNHAETNDKASPIIKKYMTSPDLLVIKPSKNKAIEQTYLVEIKYRTLKDIDDFKKSFQDEKGDLRHEAQKYLDNWGVVYMFIIVKFSKSKNVHVYIDTASNISKGFLRGIDHKDHKKWIQPSIRKEIEAQCQKTFG